MTAMVEGAPWPEDAAEVWGGIWWSASQQAAWCALCGCSRQSLASADAGAGWGDGHLDICIPRTGAGTLLVPSGRSARFGQQSNNVKI